VTEEELRGQGGGGSGGPALGGGSVGQRGDGRRLGHGWWVWLEGAEARSHEEEDGRASARRRTDERKVVANDRSVVWRKMKTGGVT
jgi:hypothetical protein